MLTKRSVSSTVIGCLAAIVVVTGCEPNQKSLDVGNPCDEPLVVRIWDVAKPETDHDAHVDATIGSRAIATIGNAITVVGSGTVAIDVATPGGSQLRLQVERSGSRKLVIGAAVCAG